MNTTTTPQADTPTELITAVVNLIETGPVPLGAYTVAEVFSVAGLLEFLEQEPSKEAITEAVRSLAARDLIATDKGDENIEVRGDLGIAVAFQQRSQVFLDARLTGTDPDTPWRFLLMPQPENVTLEVMIDALGIHFFSLRPTEDAFNRLVQRLPEGDRGPEDADFDATLAASPKKALLTVTRGRNGGEREKTDVIVAHDGDHLHVFMRDPDNPDHFKAQGVDRDQLQPLLDRLTGQPTGQTGQPTGQTGQPTGQTGQPTGQTGQPTGEAAQPTGPTAQPTA